MKELTGGRRVPSAWRPPGTVGEEILQPGDWLALYTDGITEARDSSGAWFGEEPAGGVPDARDRRRAAAAGDGPETHAGRARPPEGELQDDASILLACWNGKRDP